MHTARIPLALHPSNMDPTARLVSEDRGRWIVWSVKGGFVLSFYDGSAAVGLFPTQSAALDVAVAA